MKSLEQVANDRVERLTRQLLDAQIDQLEAQLDGLKRQREYLNGGGGAHGEEPKTSAPKARSYLGAKRFPMPGSTGEKILAHLDEHGPTSSPELAVKLGAHGSLISTTLASLRKRGFVKRPNQQGGPWARTKKTPRKTVVASAKPKSKKSTSTTGGARTPGKFTPGGAPHDILKYFEKHPEPTHAPELAAKLKRKEGLISTGLWTLKSKGFVTHSGKHGDPWSRTGKAYEF